MKVRGREGYDGSFDNILFRRVKEEMPLKVRGREGYNGSLDNIRFTRVKEGMALERV